MLETRKTWEDAIVRVIYWVHKSEVLNSDELSSRSAGDDKTIVVEDKL